MTGDGTRCVHGGHGPTETGAPLHPGPVLSSTFALGLPGEPTPPDFYGRAGNPTWRALEAAIGELDGGECVLFASGMAAIRAVFGLAAADGALVLPSDGYYLARALAHEEFAPLGVHVREVPTAGEWPAGTLDGAALVLLETPSNPGLEVADIAAAAVAAHAAGALLAVDNTTATPLGQRPLELGADLVVASDTKALAGHGDVVLGHVSARDPELAARLREARTRGGAVPGPMEAWLAHRGLGTLDLRLARQAAERRRAGRGAARAPAGIRRAVAGHPADPAHGDRGAADAALERGAAVHTGLRAGGGRFLSASGWSGRRPASVGCAARPTAGSAGATTCARSGAAVSGLRGPRRPRRGRAHRAWRGP